MIKATGGNWDRNEWPVYFIAADMETLVTSQSCNDHVLCAVNELEGKFVDYVGDLITGGKKVFIDSGVYNLSTQHAKKHAITMDEALGLAPDKVHGFNELFDRYVEIMRRFGEGVWGYIEIDQGGRENKIKTRARLEEMGLSPIPVYHPFNDGWDYFDYLAERYDRICMGNVVMADTQTRKRLIATAWERRRKYPHLWIHALGMTPSETTTAFPVNSCDSSTWISNVRWGTHKALTANATPSDLGMDFIYDTQVAPEAPRGHRKARVLCAYDAFMTSRTMRVMAEDQEKSLGADIGMFDKPSTKGKLK